MKSNLENILTPEEECYYERHLMLEEFGVMAQKRLKSAKVAVVGAGGLGCPVLQYLAGAGAGTIGIIDFDLVERGNLHRQVLYGAGDIGRPKTIVAGDRLREVNPYIHIRHFQERITAGNALKILSGFDLVVDCSDNFPTRYLLNDVSVILNIPLVHGSIYRFEGVVSVFNYRTGNGERGPEYRDLYPEPPAPGQVPDCNAAGVVGVLPGIIGSFQAAEAIKVIAGIGEPLSGRVLLFDMLNHYSRIVTVPRSDKKSVGEKSRRERVLIDYDEFCGLSGSADSKPDSESEPVPEMTVQDIRSRIENGEEVQLIDIRPPHEAALSRTGGLLIPIDTLFKQYEKIRRDCKTVLCCRSGVRSGKAVQRLRDEYGFENIYSLKGGILSWREEASADELQNKPGI